MINYARLAEQEYDSAKESGREFDIKVPCRALAAEQLPGTPNEEIEVLLGNGRKAYYRELVDAYPEVFLRGVREDRHPAALLLVVGEGPERDTLERTAVELGVAERVRFLGAVPHDDVPAICKRCCWDGFAREGEPPRPLAHPPGVGMRPFCC
jgi:glycosyltransferase involved in cell wall biosynthesis